MEPHNGHSPEIVHRLDQMRQQVDRVAGRAEEIRLKLECLAVPKKR